MTLDTGATSKRALGTADAGADITSADPSVMDAVKKMVANVFTTLLPIRTIIVHLSDKRANTSHVPKSRQTWPTLERLCASRFCFRDRGRVRPT
jgi:hypothetical protein